MKKLFRELQNRYGLNDDTLLEKYVAFRSNKKLGDVVESHHLDVFEKENLSKRPVVAVKEVADTSSKSIDNSFLTEDMMDDMNTVVNETEEHGLLESYSAADIIEGPAAIKKRPSMVPEPAPALKQRLTNGEAKEVMADVKPEPQSEADRISSRRFATRTNAGEVVCSFGSYSITGIWSRPEGELSLWHIEPVTGLPSDTQYMNEKLNDRAELLETIVDMKTKVLHSANQLTEDLGSVGIPSQENSLVGGRITSENSQARLTVKSVMLEGGRDSSGGRCVALNLSELAGKGGTGFSLFPGQIIICEGVNPSGKQVVVKRIVDSAPLIEQPSVSADASPLYIIAAAGPFTTTDNHQPDPLRDLLRNVKTYRPHLFVLFGPIVDSQHPTIRRYRDQTYEEMFQSRLKSVVEWCFHLNVPLVVVPSTREMHHHPVYPQMPYSTPNAAGKMQQMFKNVHLVSDPCTLRVGPYVIGLTSTDILMGLSAEEVSANRSGPSHDRMARLCSHLIQQRSYYPLYPPAEDVGFDYSFWNQASIPCRPHLLITPSQLKHFVKDVSNVLCVNPGKLTRGEAGGTFCRVVLHPSGPSDSKAEIIRI